MEYFTPVFIPKVVDPENPVEPKPGEPTLAEEAGEEYAERSAEESTTTEESSVNVEDDGGAATDGENGGKVKEPEFYIEKIMDKHKSKGGLMYFVKWIGYYEVPSTWEPLKKLKRFEQHYQMVREYEAELAKKKVAAKAAKKKKMMRDLKRSI